MKLAYETWGTGSAALMLIHGFTGSRAAWNHLRPLMASTVKAVAVDLPGHGGSPACTSLGGRGFAETLAALAGVADAVGTGQIDVLGYSQGARLALALAVEMPGRVRRLILESGTAGLKHRRDRAVRQRRDEALAREIEIRGISAFVARWQSRPMFAGIRKLPPKLADSVRAGRLACSERGLASSLRSAGVGAQPSFWPMLPTLRSPTLLLTGKRDLKFTTIARAMAREMPMAWCRSFEGAWHAPHLEAPEPFAREVLAFLGAPSSEAPSFDSEILA